MAGSYRFNQILERRIVAKRRDEISKNITQARLEYAKGEVFRGKVSEIMNQLNKLKL